MMVISTNRFLMFFILGPLLAIVAAAAYEIWSGDLPGVLGAIFMAAWLLFVWPLFAVSGAIDQHLARSLPVSQRAILMALIGAAVAVGLVHGIFRIILMKWWLVPPSIFVPLSMIVAVVMGLCASLSGDFRNRGDVR